MKIKEWAEEDRPREKMLLKGIASLSDAELLAILIGSGNSRETAVQLSQRILNSVNNNLNALGKLSVKELMFKFKGIGKVKAITINAALELGKRRGNSAPVQRPLIHSSSDVYRIFYPLLCDLPHEELWIALPNRSSIILWHNDPSGNPRPCRQDYLLTQHLRDAARLLEIQLLDHIVLADGSYYSYSDEGTL